MHINNLRVVGKFVFWRWRLLAVAGWLCKPPQAERMEKIFDLLIREGEVL